MPDDDLADVLLGFTNYVMNERVRCYNEGVDAERERCAKIADAFTAKHNTGSGFDSQPAFSTAWKIVVVIRAGDDAPELPPVDDRKPPPLTAP